jgi:hypothetical protein
VESFTYIIVFFYIVFPQNTNTNGYGLCKLWIYMLCEMIGNPQQVFGMQLQVPVVLLFT